MSIENGRRLASAHMVETSIEKRGEIFVHELREALRVVLEQKDADSREGVTKVLTNIGRAMEEIAQGKRIDPLSAQYSSASDRFELLFGSGSAGKRMFINTRAYDQFPHALIFPSAETFKYKVTAKSYADAFKEIFGELGTNQGTVDEPYFVVRLLEERNEN